jgi:hypothetical protein
MTQTEKVIARLMKYGQVNNFWAINNNILRLGAIMCTLRKEGWHFTGAFGRNMKKPIAMRNNYYYIIPNFQMLERKQLKLVIHICTLVLLDLMLIEIAALLPITVAMGIWFYINIVGVIFAIACIPFYVISVMFQE